MSDFNQPEYYLRREQDQRRFAARAALPETRDFHADLATRYARLAEEAAAMFSSVWPDPFKRTRKWVDHA